MAGNKEECGRICCKLPQCCLVKAEHQKPGGLLHILEIPEWKWTDISMDVVMGLPHARSRANAAWVIVDHLTKSAYFIPVRQTDYVEKLAKLYIKEIVILHEIPKIIVFDRDSHFTSKFWQAVHQDLGTTLA